MFLLSILFYLGIALSCILAAALCLLLAGFLAAQLLARRRGHRGHWWGKAALGMHAMLQPAYLLLRRFSPIAARLLAFPYQVLTLPLGIELPLGAQIGRGITLSHTSGIVIHEGAVLGNNCTLHSGVVIGGKGRQDPPAIGNNVYIGANTVIAGKIRIGDNATIGACALVREDVPPGALVGSPPATVLKANYDRPYFNFRPDPP